MLIKELVEEDIDSLYKIGLQDFGGEKWFTREFLQETMQGPGYYYGAFINGLMVGGVLVKRFDRPKLWIFYFVVDKEHRKRGIGSMLLKKIEGQCSADFPLIFVDVCDKQRGAKEFYIKHGFEKQAKIKDWFGIKQEGVIYSKRVI